MADLFVTALSLNLRSAPDPSRRNIVAVLPQGHKVTKTASSEVRDWIEVATTLSNVGLRGFVNATFLSSAAPAPTGSHASHGKLPQADLGKSNGAKRTGASSRAHAIGESSLPPLPGTHPGGKVAGILRAIDWLDSGKAAHLRWQRSGSTTYCNIYVYDVCSALGAYLPRVWWTQPSIQKLLAGQSVPALYGQTVTELAANYIFNWLNDYGGAFGWTRVFEVDDLQSQVNGGRIGIICAQRTNLNSPGHIQAIVPEHGNFRAKRVGQKVVQPLQSNAGASNFTYGFMGSNWWQGSQFRDFGFWTSAVG